MRLVRPYVLAAIALPLIVGCGDAGGPGDQPSESGDPHSPVPVLDPGAPLEPQMEAAILADDVDLVSDILAAGYDPTSPLDDGVNTLHRAACDSAADTIPVLVAAGVPLEERVNRQTPLMMAAAFGDYETTIALLEAGADVDAVDDFRFGARPIHIAVRWGNVEALSALVDFGVDVDMLDGINAHPLGWAAYFGEFEAFTYLLEQGADVNLRDDYGDTPLRAATRAGHEDIAAILRDLGAIE